MRLICACGQAECALRLRRPALLEEILVLMDAAEATAPWTSRADIFRLRGSRAMIHLVMGSAEQAREAAEVILADASDFGGGRIVAVSTNRRRGA